MAQPDHQELLETALSGAHAEVRLDSRPATWALRLIEAAVIAAMAAGIGVLIGLHSAPYFPALIGAVFVGRFLLAGFRRGFGFSGAGRKEEAAEALRRLELAGPPFEPNRVVTLLLRSRGVTREDLTALTYADIKACEHRFGPLPRLWVGTDVTLEGLGPFLRGETMHRLQPPHRIGGVRRHVVLWSAMVPVFGAVIYTAYLLRLDVLAQVMVWGSMFVMLFAAMVIRSWVRGRSGRYLTVSPKHGPLLVERTRRGEIKEAAKRPLGRAHLLAYRYRGPIGRQTDPDAETRLRIWAERAPIEVVI